MGKTLAGYSLSLPFPVGELFAQGQLLEFADGGARNCIDEDKSVGKLPLGKRLGEKRAKFFRGGRGAVLQDNGGEWTLLPFGVRELAPAFPPAHPFALPQDEAPVAQVFRLEALSLEGHDTSCPLSLVWNTSGCKRAANPLYQMLLVSA